MMILPKLIAAGKLLQRTQPTNKLQLNVQQQRQPLWGYVAIAFNRVDEDRRRLVGPNRLCAEWLLKNGGAVRLQEIPNRVLRDYNILPPESTKFHIIEVDASNSSIMQIGLEHFRGCGHIQRVILHNCKHLEENGLAGLVHLQATLRHLQVSGCSNLSDADLKVIGELKQLQNLKIFDMNYVKNLPALVQQLQKELPTCAIDAK